MQSKPNSIYSKRYNYSGDKSYGNNREKARITYNLNFPDCPIPIELQPKGDKNYIEKCPYVIDELNPCYISQCAEVDWSVSNYRNLNM
ncbi:hypothetical protein EBS02_12315, partial [bacterium]|nr:hypothetical protein [bacterium]